jgi:hypothetical protein
MRIFLVKIKIWNGSDSGSRSQEKAADECRKENNCRFRVHFTVFFDDLLLACLLLLLFFI